MIIDMWKMVAITGGANWHSVMIQDLGRDTQ
jgi:hypothetical protein